MLWKSDVNVDNVVASGNSFALDPDRVSWLSAVGYEHLLGGVMNGGHLTSATQYCFRY